MSVARDWTRFPSSKSQLLVIGRVFLRRGTWPSSVRRFSMAYESSSQSLSGADSFGALDCRRHIMHVNRPRGKWNFDLFLTKSHEDSLSDLMLHQELIREVLDVT